MAIDYHDTFDRLIAKANLVAERYKKLEQGKREADERIKSLEEQVHNQTVELQQLRQELEYLRLASTLAPSREQVEEARAIISGLVRDIDRCITDITE